MLQSSFIQGIIMMMRRHMRAGIARSSTLLVFVLAGPAGAQNPMQRMPEVRRLITAREGAAAWASSARRGMVKT